MFSSKVYYIIKQVNPSKAYSSVLYNKEKVWKIWNFKILL